MESVERVVRKVFTVAVLAWLCVPPLSLAAVAVVGRIVWALRQDRVVTASDSPFIFRGSVGLESCLLCVCDVNGSGGMTASDALLALQAGVGRKASLTCPPC